MRSIFSLMPFDNTVVKLKMSGAALREALDHGAGLGKSMIQVSGASFRYQRDKEPGKRLAEVRVGGQPIDPKRTYTVATADFLVKGGDGYSALANAPEKDYTQKLLRDVFAECAASQKTLKTPPGGRMVAGLP